MDYMSEDYSESLEADILAATLQMALADSKNLMEFLAKKFELALPDQTTVRRGGWFLSKEKPVEAIELRFDDYQYFIEQDKPGLPTAKVMKLVRGIALKTDQVAVEQWLKSVAQQLALQAERSEATRQALSRFVE